MSQGNAGKRQYTADDHKQAFDVFFVSRNISEVTRTLGLAYETTLRWKSPNYACQYACPYHNWDTLIEEQLRTIAAQEKVKAQGISDPIVQSEAMAAALNNDPFQAPAPTYNEVRAALKSVTSDEERLHHWRLLYAKVFFEITGVPIDYSTLKEELTGTEKLFSAERFKKGLKVTNAENAVRTLGYIQDQILAIERRMNGLDGNVITVKGVTKEPGPDQLSIDQLRLLAQATPAETVSESE
jgi:hypothetical protein